MLIGDSYIYAFGSHICAQVVGLDRGRETYADEFLDLALLHALLESALLGGR